MVDLIRLTKSDCTHEWIIEASTDLSFQLAPNVIDGEGTWKMNGYSSPGVCRKCQERKWFVNSTPTSTGLNIRLGNSG